MVHNGYYLRFPNFKDFYGTQENLRHLELPSQKQNILRIYFTFRVIFLDSL